MELESFRVTNFRSINDSGDVEVGRITALLGRNESGKSNLLLALRSLNPAEGFKPLSPTKDFPRHRRLTECNDKTRALSSIWRLSSSDQTALAAILPRAAGVTHVTIGRNFGDSRWVVLNLPPIEFDRKKLRGRVSKLVAAIQVLGEEHAEEAKRLALETSAKSFGESGDPTVGTPQEWAAKVSPVVTSLRKALASASADLNETLEDDLNTIEHLAKTISSDEPQQQTARDWVVNQLPIFIYLADYPELSGQQDIQRYIERKNQGHSTDADRDFEKLCKVAGLDPMKLHQLLAENKSEERNQLANRASAVVTAEIRKLWKDRPLKVRFNIDAQHFNTFISDPNSTYDVEVNLDERSRGFRWFFSFYITFAADTDGGRAKNAILLLDEPGLYLHIQSQKDLLAHWEKDFDNQILYTTHSPFMVPVRTLDWLRTVNIDEAAGTTVTNDPTGDMRTLAPIRAALGYHFADTLFIHQRNLVVEGVTDWWILEAVSTYLKGIGRSCLSSDMAVCPVDGATKVTPMVSILVGNKLTVLVLFDDDREGRQVQKEIITKKLLREKNTFLVSDVMSPKPNEADIEDLLDPAVYLTLVGSAYEKELEGKSISYDDNIPRIVKRVESAFEKVGLKFQKTRVAGLFFRTMSSDPKAVTSEKMLGYFEAIFQSVSNRFQEISQNPAEPFH